LFEFLIGVFQLDPNSKSASEKTKKNLVLFSFEARNEKELSVTQGESVVVTRKGSLYLGVVPLAVFLNVCFPDPSGWSIVTRESDGSVGAVPTSYLSSDSALSSPKSTSPTASLSSSLSAIVSPRAAERATAEERLMLEFQTFEFRALAALGEERRAKASLASKIEMLEQRAVE
jgi:hypothetical protein